MAYIVLICILIIALVVWKHEKVFSKMRLFKKKCKWLIVIELIIVIALSTCNILDSSVIIKEKHPHTYETLKRETLKEGQINTYYKIKIEKAGITKVKVLVDDVEEEYKYGYGFTYYYGTTSCMCGTQIIFEKTLTGVIKITILAIIIIDLFILVFIKSKNTEN